MASTYLADYDQKLSYSSSAYCPSNMFQLKMWKTLKAKEWEFGNMNSRLNFLQKSMNIGSNVFILPRLGTVLQ